MSNNGEMIGGEEMKKTIYVTISGGNVQDFGANFQNDYNFEIIDYDNAETNEEIEQLDLLYDKLCVPIKTYKVFDVTLKGYNDDNSDTDHLVLWVAASSICNLQLELKEVIGKIQSIELLNMTPNIREGLDFTLPVDKEDCIKKIKEL